MKKTASVDEKLAGSRWYFLQHPVIYRLYQATREAVSRHARGRTLDLGAGRLNYRDLLTAHGADIEYVSLDIERAHDELDVVADVCAGTGFPDAHFDTIFCTQVLEHVAEPIAFLSEARRVCRPGGRLIITVPFLFYLHGQPHDYWRFTPAGLASVAEAAGFRVIETQGVGGLLAFLIMIAYTAVMHPIRFLPNALLAPLCLSTIPWAWLDKTLDTSGRFPAAVLLVAEKK